MTGRKQGDPALCGLPPENRGGAKVEGRTRNPGRADGSRVKDDSESRILETVFQLIFNSLLSSKGTCMMFKSPH